MTAMTSVPQPIPSMLPKNTKVITMLAVKHDKSTIVLRTDIFIPYLDETAFTKKS